jgi:hypothetical protein
MTDEIDTTQDKVEDTEVQNETIDDLFNAKPEAEVKAEAAEEAKGETETEETKVEAKAETKETAKTEAETPAAEKESVPLKALTEERHKRQEAERRAQDAEAKLKQASQEDKKVPDPVEDPEGYKQYMEDEANLNALRTKVSLSRDIMLDLKEDYAEKETVFVELAKTNPFLVQQMNASPNPAKFAYQTAVEHLDVQQYRDPKFREKLEAEIKAKVEADLKAQREGKQPDKKSALDVPDLTKATAAGKNSDKGENLAELDDVMEGSAF